MASFGSTKRHFWVMLAVMSVVVIALLVAVIVLAVTRPKEVKPPTTPTTPKDKPTKNYCYKSHCLLAASEILEAVNTSVNPCDDFYEHSCGTWIKYQRLSPDKGRVDTFTKLRRILNNRLTDLIQESSTEDEPIAIQKAKTFFRSCMDLNSIEIKSENRIQKVIKAMENASDLVDLVLSLIQVRGNVLIPAYVSRNLKDTSHNIITVSALTLILDSKSYYNKSTEGFTAFTQLIDSFSDMFLGNNMTEKIIDFEWGLKDIYYGWSENMSDHDNIFTIEELHNRTKDQVNWIEIFRRAVNNSGSEVEVNMTTKVLVFFPEYVEQLADLLNSTDLDTLRNYAVTRYIIKKIHAMPLKYRDLYHRVDKAFLIANVPPSRKEVCLRSVSSVMPHVIGRLYVDNYFPPSSKKLALDLVKSLRISLRKMFNDTDWMDDITRTAAIEKVDAVLAFVGYDEDIKDDRKLSEIFQDFNFTEDNFMQNLIKVGQLYGRYAFSGLESNNSRASWGGMNAAIVNAFYSPLENSIFFPAGILQPPFYDAEYPLSMLFGAMGAVVGHEFTHGFDISGAQFDKVGNLKNWWTQHSMKEFKLRAAGLRKQYSEFALCKNPPCTLHINGNLTLGENIADNGGVKTAFMAYKDYVNNHKIKQKLLPGLSYTSDQLFFVGYAHIWCQKIRRSALIKQLLKGPHSPAIARVIATLQNSEAFATAFKCKKDSPMNPTIKYGVW